MCIKKKRSACLRPGCGQPSRSRGLCWYCYKKACELVKCGKTTWDKLEKTGRALKAQPTDYGATKRWLLGIS